MEIEDMEEGKTYLVTYKYTLPAINEDITVKELPLTRMQLMAICFPDVDVYNHKILEIKEYKES